MARNPFESIALPRGARTPTKPTQALSEDDVVLILSLPNTLTPVGKRDHAILSLLFGAGLRRSEVVELWHEDVVQDYTCWKIRIEGKTGYRETSLAPWVAESLLRHMEENPIKAGPVFNISGSGVWLVFKRYLKQAGIFGRYSPHSARATAITALLDRGHTHRDVQRFSGHSSVAMVELYDRRKNDVTKNPGLRLVYGSK